MSNTPNDEHADDVTLTFLPNGDGDPIVAKIPRATYEQLKNSALIIGKSVEQHILDILNTSSGSSPHSLYFDPSKAS